MRWLKEAKAKTKKLQREMAQREAQKGKRTFHQKRFILIFNGLYPATQCTKRFFCNALGQVGESFRCLRDLGTSETDHFVRTDKAPLNPAFSGKDLVPHLKKMVVNIERNVAYGLCHDKYVRTRAL
jgi:hypothetical protein